MNSLRSRLPLKHRFTLVFSALFAVALALAQPHRVHHFFEQTGHVHSHGDADSHQHDPSQAPVKSSQPECLVQALSQHCSAIPVTATPLPIVTTTVQIDRLVLSGRLHTASFSPFLQRAPPVSSSSLGN